MRLTRWEPFRDMDELLKGFSPFLTRMPRTTMEGEFEFMPLADVIERDKEYLIKVDLPEVPKEDVKVFFEQGVLSIKGERKVEKEVKGEKMHRSERFYGAFERSFMLPDDIDPKMIRAESKDGVLWVHIPKVEVQKTKPVAISIQ
jgi:HSP20 family protein